MMMCLKRNLFMFLFSTILGKNFKCPEESHWVFRAKYVCEKQEQYTCLLNVHTNNYKEECHGPAFRPPGRKVIIRGNYDIDKCSQERFQPITFSTEGQSQCIFLKSNCNGEGQETFNIGTSETDRSCTCAENFKFIFPPLNPPQCRPITEDCSCYRISTETVAVMVVEKGKELNEVSKSKKEHQDAKTAIVFSLSITLAFLTSAFYFIKKESSKKSHIPTNPSNQCERETVKMKADNDNFLSSEKIFFDIEEKANIDNKKIYEDTEKADDELTDQSDLIYDKQTTDDNKSISSAYNEDLVGSPQRTIIMNLEETEKCSSLCTTTENKEIENVCTRKKETDSRNINIKDKRLDSCKRELISDKWNLNRKLNMSDMNFDNSSSNPEIKEFDREHSDKKDTISRVKETESYFLVFDHLVCTTILNQLRDVFTKRFSPKDLQNMMHQNMKQFCKLFRERFLTEEHIGMLFPKDGEVCSKSFDLMMLVCFFLLEKDSRFEAVLLKNLPDDTETSLDADFARVIYFTNVVKRCTDRQMSESELFESVSILTKAMSRICGEEAGKEFWKVFRMRLNDVQK